MSSQENNHQNDNQLLIDFIKDTYTIESNKHLFICIPYLINGLSGYEGTYKHSLSANGIELISSSEQKTQNQNEQKWFLIINVYHRIQISLSLSLSLIKPTQPDAI